MFIGKYFMLDMFGTINFEVKNFNYSNSINNLYSKLEFSFRRY
jgi:hypothetical protein